MEASDPTTEGDGGDADLSFRVVQLAWGDGGMRWRAGGLALRVAVWLGVRW
jgi:hypothetical protein